MAGYQTHCACDSAGGFEHNNETVVMGGDIIHLVFLKACPNYFEPTRLVIIKKTDSRAGKMAQWVGLAAKPDSLGSIPQNAQGGRRELAPASRPLTYTHAAWQAHATRMYTHRSIKNKHNKV